jgi:hypothetical protein
MQLVAKKQVAEFVGKITFEHFISNITIFLTNIHKSPKYAFDKWHIPGEGYHINKSRYNPFPNKNTALITIDSCQINNNPRSL